MTIKITDYLIDEQVKNCKPADSRGVEQTDS